MVKWICDGTIPPASAFIETIGETDEIVRDKHGNAMNGVITLHTDVPLARIVAATPKGRPSWYCVEQQKLETKQRGEASILTVV
ncbi:hypothetical protein N7463_009802 [Penicillium fimorum]|uniref:Alpha/beta hydrolase domain-containing protein n=1 Tax=Penicillium fimorum TaxID=1882269 RepID=A0A9W9XJJ3_9EURO|nr:hypothetical protein N7463_009802 [Penicillium fimorum]